VTSRNPANLLAFCAILVKVHARLSAPA